MAKEIFTSENTIVVDTSDARFKTAENQTQEVNRIHTLGKNAITVCCFHSQAIIKRAIGFRLSKPDLELFRLCFNHHAISDFMKSDFRILPGMEINVDGFIHDVFNRASLFERQALQNYFLEAVYKDVQRLNTQGGFEKSLKEFNEKFQIHRGKFDKATTSAPDVEMAVTKDVLSKIFHKEYKNYKDDLPYPEFQKILNEAIKYLEHYYELWPLWTKEDKLENLNKDRGAFLMIYENWTGIQQPDNSYPPQYNVQQARASEKLEGAAMTKVIDLLLSYVNLINNKAEPEVTLQTAVARELSKTKKPKSAPPTFEDMFVNPEYAEYCLSILRELDPPVVDSDNNYIGKITKGVFRLWVDKLKKKAIIKHFTNDIIYADAIRTKIKGLTFTKDASEFRRNYPKLNKSDIGLQIANKLSQFSQKGEMGK